MLKQNYKNIKYKTLAKYKNKTLTTKVGIWRGKEYDHILPKSDLQLNIIDIFRTNFWEYFNSKKIHLHQNFHHLNSSQALCFNLFFPLFNKNIDYLTYTLLHIIEVLPLEKVSVKDTNELFSVKHQDLTSKYSEKLDNKNVKINGVINCEFEKTIDINERTNFDFFVTLSNSHRVIFEIKYTEYKFGSAPKNKSHLKKYHSIYEKKLNGIIKQKYINENFVLKNYQLIRNLSYLNNKTTVVFLYPKDNEQLKETYDIVTKILEKDKIPNLKIVYLEDFVNQILNSVNLEPLHTYFREFKRKYIE